MKDYKRFIKEARGNKSSGGSKSYGNSGVYLTSHHTENKLYISIGWLKWEFEKSQFSSNPDSFISAMIDKILTEVGDDDELGYRLAIMTDRQSERLFDDISDEMHKFATGERSRMRFHDAKHQKLWRSLTVDKGLKDEHLDCINDEAQRLGGEVTWSCEGHTSGPHMRPNGSFRHPYFVMEEMPQEAVRHLEAALRSVPHTETKTAGKGHLLISCDLENTPSNMMEIEKWWNDVCKVLRNEPKLSV